MFGPWSLFTCLPLACAKAGIEVPDSLGPGCSKTLIDLQKSMALLLGRTPRDVVDCLDSIGLQFGGHPGNCLNESLNLLQLIQTALSNEWIFISSVDADTIMMEFEHTHPLIDISHLKQEGKNLQLPK